MILKFDQFINENYMDSPIYRTTSEEFLVNLIKNGKISSKGKDFISMSNREDSGGQDDYGNVLIEFDREKLSNQGAIECDYEDMNFWAEFPKICKHVTGYKGEQDYYKRSGSELSWEQLLAGYAEEDEVVIPSIKMENGLIKKVTFKKGKPSKETIELLKKNHIPYK